MRKISVLGIKNHRSAAVRGGGAPGAPPPPLDPLVLISTEYVHRSLIEIDIVIKYDYGASD